MTTEKQPQTIARFIADQGIEFALEPSRNNPNMDGTDKWNATASHWRCTFYSKDLDMLRTYFSQGSALKEPPTAAEVLDCLAMDASGIENAKDFDDWASEYGYDTDSRKAFKTFEVCQKQAEELKTFLGDEAYQSLLWDTERE